MLSALLTGSVHAAVADDAAAEFAAGYLWGTKAEDKRPYIVGCFETDKDLNDLVDGIMDDYSKGDVSSADKKWNDAAPKFKKAMSKCDDVKGEFKDLSDYSKNVDKKTIKARTQKYQAEIGQLGGEMVERWQTGVYFDAGMYDGQISQYMGLVPNPYPDMVFADDEQDATAPARMIAGWLFGVSTQEFSFQDEIVDCFTPNDSLTADYYAAMKAFENNDTDTGYKKLDDAKQYYDDAFTKCDKKITDPLSQWTAKRDALAQIKDWDKISAQIYENNKEIIDDNVGYEFNSWDRGVFFDSGMFGGRNDLIFIQQAPAQQLADDAQNPEAPAQFIAGWLYGVSTQAFNMQDAIVACYTRNDDLTAAYYDAQAAFVAGDSQTGYSKLNDAKQYYDAFFANCGTGVTDPLTQWSDNIDALAQIDDWDTISAQIYLDNKQILDDDLSYEVNSWNRGVFFDAGMFAGRYQLIFYEQAPAQIIDEMLSYI
jgi:hypothetical protein